MLICRLVGVNEEIKTSALAGALGGWVAFNVYTDCQPVQDHILPSLYFALVNS